MTGTVPHSRTIVAFCVAAIIGYAIFSGWVVFYSQDDAQRGDVIGTWKSFAVAAFAFWLGSSSGGKAAANPDTPTPVTVENKPDEPVPTKPVKMPEVEFAHFEDDPTLGASSERKE